MKGYQISEVSVPVACSNMIAFEALRGIHDSPNLQIL